MKRNPKTKEKENVTHGGNNNNSTLKHVKIRKIDVLPTNVISSSRVSIVLLEFVRLVLKTAHNIQISM